MNSIFGWEIASAPVVANLTFNSRMPYTFCAKSATADECMFVVAVNNKQICTSHGIYLSLGACELWRQFWLGRIERETEIQIHFSTIVNNQLKLNNFRFCFNCTWLERENSLHLIWNRKRTGEVVKMCLQSQNKDKIASWWQIFPIRIVKQWKFLLLSCEQMCVRFSFCFALVFLQMT